MGFQRMLTAIRNLRHACSVLRAVGPTAPMVTVNEHKCRHYKGIQGRKPPDPGPWHHQGPILYMVMILTQNQTGLHSVSFDEGTH